MKEGAIHQSLASPSTVKNHQLGVKVILSKIGPDRRSVRTGPDRGSLIRSSVQAIFIFGLRSGPGLDQWTGLVDRI